MTNEQPRTSFSNQYKTVRFIRKIIL